MITNNEDYIDAGCYIGWFANWVIDSNIALTDLPPVADTQIDIDLHVRFFNSDLLNIETWMHVWCDDSNDSSNIVRLVKLSGSGRYLLRFEDRIEIEYRQAQKLALVRYDGTVGQALLRHVVLDQFLPRIISLKQNLVVHSSGVSFNGGLALFLGKSGCGKSTLAGELQNFGCELVSDDCNVILASDKNEYTAVPTYQSLRLSPQSYEHVFTGVKKDVSTVPVVEGGSKLKVPTCSMSDSVSRHKELPVKAVFTLKTDDLVVEAVHLRMITIEDTRIELVKNMFRLDIDNFDATASKLAMAKSVAKSTRNFSLTYPRDYSMLKKVCETVLEALV